MVLATPLTSEVVEGQHWKDQSPVYGVSFGIVCMEAADQLKQTLNPTDTWRQSNWKGLSGLILVILSPQSRC